MNFNKHIIFLPKRLWFEMNQNGHLDALSLYVQIKKIYRSGRIENATQQRIASLTNLSQTTIQKNLKIIIDYGLAYFDCKALVFRDPNKLTQYANKQNRVHLMHIYVMKSYKLQKYKIKSIAALSSLKKQEAQINKTNHSIKQLSTSYSSKELKKAIKHLKNKSGLDKKYCTLSNRSFARLINKSESTAKRWKKILKTQGIITIDAKFKEVPNYSGKDLRILRSNSLDFDAFFNRLRLINGKVYEQLSNELKLVYWG